MSTATLQKPRVCCLERSGIDALLPKMAKFQGPPTKTCPAITSPHLLTPSLLKTLGVVQRAKKELRIRFPIFLVGAFSINKCFLTPNSDVWSFGLSKSQHKNFGQVTPVHTCMSICVHMYIYPKTYILSRPFSM